MSSNYYYIGMDVGTTNCCACVLGPNGLTDVIQFGCGDRLLRSVVCFNSDGTITVGKAGLKVKEIAKGNVVTNSKRIFGMAYDSPHVSVMKNYCRAKVVKGDDGNACFFVPSLNRNVYPEEICMYLIKEMYTRALAKIDGGPVGSVTITVPATYSLAQRALTRDAAIKAGITCPIRILNEPTAAAIAYGIQVTNRNGYILIYDLGGGTFDVSIVEVKGGKSFDFLRKDGDMAIGGETFDRNLVLYISGLYSNDTNDDELMPEDLKEKQDEGYLRANSKLLDICKEAKEMLSGPNIDSTAVDLEPYFNTLKKVMNVDNFDMDPEEMWEYNITRDTFEGLIKSDIDSTISITKRCIDECGLTISDIDAVVLVGGSSRIPMVKKALTEVFKANVLSSEVNPDECVAIGASLFCKENLNDGNIKDRTSSSISIETRIGCYETIIPRDVYFPTEGEHTFYLGANNVGYFAAPVFEGYDEGESNRRLLTTIEVDNDELIGEAHSLVFHYRINLEGELTVRVVDKESDDVLIEEHCVLLGVC